MTVFENYVAVSEFLKSKGAPAELVEFVDGRCAQEQKSRETAKAKRLEKTGGVKRDASESEFYTALRASLYKALTTDYKTGKQLIEVCDFKNPSGKAVLPAQVAMALKPLIADGTVVIGEVKVAHTNAQGLTSETMQKAYKLA